MPFKGPRPFGIGYEDGRAPVMKLVRREPYGNPLIPVFQIIDLIQHQFPVFRRIERHTMINCKGDVPVLKKGHEVIDVLERGAAGRYNYRLFRLSDVLY